MYYFCLIETVENKRFLHAEIHPINVMSDQIEKLHSHLLRTKMVRKILKPIKFHILTLNAIIWTICCSCCTTFIFYICRYLGHILVDNNHLWSRWSKRSINVNYFIQNFNHFSYISTQFVYKTSIIYLLVCRQVFVHFVLVRNSLLFQLVNSLIVLVSIKLLFFFFASFVAA